MLNVVNLVIHWDAGGAEGEFHKHYVKFKQIIIF